MRVYPESGAKVEKKGVDFVVCIALHCTPMPSEFEIDDHGFAPTRIVRVRWSRHRAVARFYRMWMKPGNVAFPPQERLLIGAEHMEALVKFMERRQPRDEEIRLDPTPTAGGVCPKSLDGSIGEVGGSSGLVSSRHDWPEDFGEENGDYLGRCIECRVMFTGLRRRLRCKLCAPGEQGTDSVSGGSAPTKGLRGAMPTPEAPPYRAGVYPNFSPAAQGEVEPLALLAP